MAELEIYAENTRSLLIYMNLHLLGIDNSDAIIAASHIGRCIGICDIIKKAPFYIAKHRNYIPTEILIKVFELLLISVFSIIYILIKYGTLGEKDWLMKNFMMLYLSNI